MKSSLLGRIFGCAHNTTTFPLTPSRRSEHGGVQKGTYVVCLSCGKEFEYSWKDMCIGSSIEKTPASPTVPQAAGHLFRCPGSRSTPTLQQGYTSRAALTSRSLGADFVSGLHQELSRYEFDE
jgi:hypothetical protein